MTSAAVLPRRVRQAAAMKHGIGGTRSAVIALSGEFSSKRVA